MCGATRAHCSSVRRSIETLKIASWDGALWLGAQERIGAIGQGRDADLVVVKGDPSRNLAITNLRVQLGSKPGFCFRWSKSPVNLGCAPQPCTDFARGANSPT
jgi:hypothetical protein